MVAHNKSMISHPSPGSVLRVWGWYSLFGLLHELVHLASFALAIEILCRDDGPVSPTLNSLSFLKRPMLTKVGRLISTSLWQPRKCLRWTWLPRCKHVIALIVVRRSSSLARSIILVKISVSLPGPMSTLSTSPKVKI
jgi:hypothetical protein